METIVVGGGAIGLGIAWRLSQRGRDVLVLERAEPGSGASYHAAGMLAPITEATFGEDALLRLNLTSAAAYPAFLRDLAAATGRSLQSGAPGTLFVALDRDQLEALERLYEFQRGLGLAVEWLRGSRCRELEPALHPAVRAGIGAAEKEVDPRSLTAALGCAVAAAGGRVRSGAEVARLLWTGGHITGVALTTGEEIAAPSVVLAAGCWSGGIAGVPKEVADAVRPVKGQILRLRPRAGEALPIGHLLRTEEVYLVPRSSPARGDEIVVGATVEEQGFDTSLTGGGVYELLRAAIEVVPGVREMKLAEASAGLRPGSRDNAPLLGPLSDPPFGPLSGGWGAAGLVVATGHHRNGILLTPVTADAIASVVCEGVVPEAIAPFRPDRFARACC
ncbi:MAG: glycine oxidase ThiO [Actinobacteria bacterium]|nr:MAG: glycine oxidase ThiO [Actinomycetota bacterium]